MERNIPVPIGRGGSRISVIKARSFAALSIAAVMLLGSLPAAHAANPDASTSPQVIAAAQKAVQQARNPLSTFPFATTSAKAEKNKTIVVVTCISTGGCLDPGTAVANAGKALGWNVKIINGQGNPAVWNSAVQQAITLHADGIVLVAVPPFEVQGALKQANAAKIPVISVLNPLAKGDGVYGHVSPDQAAQGKLMADWVIADSNGAAHVLVIQDPSHQDLKIRVSSFVKEFANCTGCKIDGYVNTTAASLYTRLAGATVSSLEQHADADYIVAATDGYTPFAVQAVKQVNRTGKVKVAGYDGSVQSEGLIHGGAQAVSLAEPLSFSGWLATDLLVGAFAGQAPHDAKTLPTRILDKANAPAKGEWDGDFSYMPQLKKLWGLM